jgi:hypothetical protein
MVQPASYDTQSVVAHLPTLSQTNRAPLMKQVAAIQTWTIQSPVSNAGHRRKDKARSVETHPTVSAFAPSFVFCHSALFSLGYSFLRSLDLLRFQRDANYALV